MKKLILALLILAGTVHAQSLIVISGSKTASGGGPNTWTLVRHTLVIAPCNNSTSCTAAVSAIGSGNLLVLVEVGSSASAYINGGFGSTGGTWVHPGGSSAGACNVQGVVGSDCIYVLHTTSCSSSCNIPFTTSGYFSFDSADIFEYTPSTGTATFDTANTSSGTFNATPPGVALTISGTSDLVIQNIAAQDHYCTAISSPYTSATDFTVSPNGQAGYAAAVNLSSVSAPTWTCAGMTRYSVGAVAFK